MWEESGAVGFPLSVSCFLIGANGHIQYSDHLFPFHPPIELSLIRSFVSHFTFTLNILGLHCLSLCPQLLVGIMCFLCRWIPGPRITVSVVEATRAAQRAKLLQRPGAGPPPDVRLCWPNSPSLSVRPCGRPVGVEADGHIPAIPWTEESWDAPSLPLKLSISDI